MTTLVMLSVIRVAASTATDADSITDPGEAEAAAAVVVVVTEVHKLSQNVCPAFLGRLRLRGKGATSVRLIEFIET